MKTKTRAAPRLPEPTVIRGIYYEEYLRLRKDPANDHLRMVYHDGTLELMSPEYVHETPSRRLAVLVTIVAEELDLPFQGARSTTFRRGVKGSKKGKGKEPDESFYFANAEKVVALQEIDLDRDPPPDLWIEIDNRSSSKGGLPLYAAFGVPEVWRFQSRSRRLWFGRLVPGATYEPIEHSLSLPFLTPSLTLEALALGDGVLESTWSRQVRDWVREALLPK